MLQVLQSKANTSWLAELSSGFQLINATLTHRSQSIKETLESVFV